MRGSLRTQKCLPALLLFLALMVGSILGEPAELVYNGNFESENFNFGYVEADIDAMDFTYGRMDGIPDFRVVHNGVQIMDGYRYHLPGDSNCLNGKFLCHLNTKLGPGVLHTVPLITPRKGAPYTLQFLMADNPDGGALSKALRVSILVNNRFSSPKPQFFQVSSPYSTQSTIDWRLKNISFVGTGEPTKLQFESLMPGHFGPLIDNISVTVQTLVENGSFEMNTTIPESNLSDATIISAPSSGIPGWFVKSGQIKRILYTYRFDMPLDLTTHFVDLNAEATAGTIVSNSFITKPGKKYTVLFDTAANAENIATLRGYMSASAFSYPGGKLLASRSVFVSSEGYNPRNLGWTTYLLEFKAQERESFIQFSSHIEGAWDGPLLDNVVVYEVHKPGHFKYIAPTWSAGTPRKPSVWTTSLTSALVMCVFGHFISEMLLLYN